MDMNRYREVSVLDMSEAPTPEVQAILDEMKKLEGIESPVDLTNWQLGPKPKRSKIILEIRKNPALQKAIDELGLKGYEIESAPGDPVYRIGGYLPNTIKTTPDLYPFVIGNSTTTLSTESSLQEQLRRRREQYEHPVGPRIGDTLNNPPLTLAGSIAGIGMGSITGAAQSTPECAQAASETAMLDDLPTVTFELPNLAQQASATRFINYCLEPIVQVYEKPPMPLPEFIARSNALSVMGVFEIARAEGNPQVFCSGFLVDARRVVTARHCFYEDERAADLRFDMVQALHFRRIGFRRLTPPYKLLTVERISTMRDGFDVLRGGQPDQAIRADADIIVLDLAEDAAGVARIELADMVSWRHSAWLAGPFATTNSPYAAAAIPNSVQSIRWPANSECAVYPQNQCLVHVCQAIGDFSGSALFVKGSQPGITAIGGMHLGAYSKLTPACPPLTGFALIDGSYSVDRGANGGIGVGPIREYLAALAVGLSH